MFGKIYDSLLTVVYPQACGNCGSSVENSADGAACEDCWTKTKIFSGAETLCAKCGAVHQNISAAPVEIFCHRCDEHFYDFAASVGVYENALAATVLSLKSEPFVAGRAREIFVSRFQNLNFQDATLIVPVPLSKKRLLERGFNQAAVLAKVLAQFSRVELDEKSLVRKIHTPMHRAGMDGKARAMSVADAFEVKRPNLIKDRKILLIDDVFTSGATVSNCAKVLKKNGAKSVCVFTMAKTL